MKIFNFSLHQKFLNCEWINSLKDKKDARTQTTIQECSIANAQNHNFGSKDFLSWSSTKKGQIKLALVALLIIEIVKDRSRKYALGALI